MSLPPFVPLHPLQMALIERNPVPVLVLDGHERVRYVNPAGRAFAEDPNDDPTGVVVWDRYPGLVGSGFQREYARVLRDGATARFEEYRPEVDRWFAVMAYPMEDGLIATLRDITQERRNADAVRRSEQTLRLAQESARIGTFSRDLRLEHSEWSDQLFRLLGLEPGAFDPNLADRDPERSFIHPDDRAMVQAVWRRALVSGKTEYLRHRVFRADGTERVFEANVFTVRDQHDEPERVVGTVRDITDELQATEEKAQLEAQMQQAQKLESLGILAGGIAHDFNNLLVGILGNASLALLDLPGDSPVRHSVAEIEQAAQRAAELTRQLLAYAGKGRFVVEAVDLSQVVREMTALLRTAVSRNAQVSLSLAESLPAIEVDVTQLRQVVMNLITNASDALGESGGMIYIHTGQQDVDADYLESCVPGTEASPGQHVYVEVRDEGGGMDPATRSRMFDPFFTTKFTGRGLGLAATLGIMRGHRGAIRVYSEPGKGTSMKLHFPAGGRAAASATPAADATWIGDGHVLIVDDEPSVRAVTRALLRRRGFAVTEVAGGDEAVALLDEDPTRYQLVLLDLTMPGMNGEETFRELRKRSPALKVILMSGYNEQEVTRSFVGRGLAAFLQKPFRAEELDGAVRRVLALPE
jgi:PAS domain S-box-containing protein